MPGVIAAVHRLDKAARLGIGSPMILRSLRLFVAPFLTVLFALFLAGCAGGLTEESPGVRASRLAMTAAIPSEATGDYWIGRRYFNANYKFWGYVRRPRQLWGTAQLVVMNEGRMLAPDRARDAIGIDNGAEYRVRGSFSGQKVYEPASNRFYPEFVPTSFELVNPTPPSILPPGYRDTVEIQNPLP